MEVYNQGLGRSKKVYILDSIKVELVVVEVVGKGGGVGEEPAKPKVEVK